MSIASVVSRLMGSTPINNQLSPFLTELAAAKPPESDITRQVYEWALELDDENGKAWNGLGRHFLAMKEWARARQCFEKAIGSTVRETAPCINAAIACDQEGDLTQAKLWCWQALGRDSKSLAAHLQLFSICERQGDLGLAMAVVEQGLTIDPTNDELLFARATVLLKHHRLARGWLEYESRPTKVQLASVMDEYPEWDGLSLNGKTLMVVREQGFGDELMFARYLPLLRAEGMGAGKIVMYGYPELARLFAEAFPFIEIITSYREAEHIELDYWVGTASLPLKLRNLLVGIDRPAAVSPSLYCVIPDRPKVHGAKLKVGLCWKGNPKHSRDAIRSLTFEKVKALLEVPGCEFVSLQFGEQESELPKPLDYGHDWLDTARVVAGLDLVISVDTGMAHLAASMGKPTWILINSPSDWRWGTEGPSSAWYPSVRLFRDATIAQVARVLERYKRVVDRPACPTCNDVGTLNDPEVEAAVGHTAVEAAFGHSVAQLVREYAEGYSKPCPTCTEPERPGIITRECRYGPMTWFANDHYIGRALDLYGEYSQSEVELLAAVLQLGDTVIECGANVGGLTVPLTHIVGPSGRVIAFEPQPAYHSLLRRNLAGLENAKALQVPLGASCGPITMREVETAKRHAPGWESTGPEFETRQMAIDEMHLEVCHLIKIDVDGQELEILKGAEATIMRCRPLIYVENDKPEEYPDLLPWLARHGYRLHQHYAPLYNPENFRGYHVNVFGQVVSAMLLAVPTERHELRMDTMADLKVERIRIGRK